MKITALVDQFFRRCSDIVVRHDGILDNFRGDAVLAFFNVPIERPDHVAQAVAAAIEVQRDVPEINRSLGEQDCSRLGSVSRPE